MNRIPIVGVAFVATMMVGASVIGDEIEAFSMVTHDGRRMVSRDGGQTFELVATNTLPSKVPAARPWRLYVVKATHTDIGLHNPQYIQRHGTVKRLEDAMRLVDTDPRGDDDPAAYRYVAEGTWFWENYPMDRGVAAAWNVISNYVRRGRIGIGATCAGNHTHVYGPEELARSTHAKRRLAEIWGVDSRTMLMSDNPGMSWSIVKPYVEAGIENCLFSPNQWNPHPSTIWPCDRSKEAATWNPDAGGGGNYIDVRWDSKRPMVFWWESPDRSAKMLVWTSTQYGYGMSAFGINPRGARKDVEQWTARQLAKMEKRYPYDIWLAANYTDDEPANRAFADFAAKWNAKWACPTFVTAGRLEEPFDELKRRFGDKIETIRGEMTSGWLQHVVSAPELLSDKLNAERRLAAAETLWRADPNRDASLKIDFEHAWECLILNDEHSYGTSGYQGRRVFETWMQHRDWIERADAFASKVLARYGVPREPAAPTGTVECALGKMTENRFYRVVVNDRGEILSIYDKELGRELLRAPANRLLYTRDNHKTWCDEELLGAKITRRVSLPADAKRIDIENRFEHAHDLFNTSRYKRFGYIGFPFKVPNGQFKAALGGGEVIDPYRDQSGYATDAYVASRDWCAVENDTFGVALLQRDTLLIEFGEIHPDKTCFTGVPPSGSQTLYSYAFTDWLQMHQPDGDSISFTLRYAITSYAGTWESARIKERTETFVNPWRRSRGDTPYQVEPGDTAETASHRRPWTGLLEKPRAGHGELDGQLYLLWSAELSPDFDHYELYRDGQFIANVTNEAPDGIPYRIARYVDLGLGSHQTYSYTLRKVWKDGRKDAFSEPFTGLTRAVFDVEAIEREGVRVEINRRGAYVSGWTADGMDEVFFRPERANWSEEEVHGGVPICWPWFGRREGCPKHGLARYATWTLMEKIGKHAQKWRLVSNEMTRQIWPHEFRLDYVVSALSANRLALEFTATNTGKEPFEAAGGFHPYFRVADSLKVMVDDKPIGTTPYLVSFPADGRSHTLTDAVTGRVITLKAEGTDGWIAWNPGVERTPLCETLGPDEWKRFFCVEPYNAQPYVLRPGESRKTKLVIHVNN